MCEKTIFDRMDNEIVEIVRLGPIEDHNPHEDVLRERWTQLVLVDTDWDQPDDDYLAYLKEQGA